MVRCYDSFLQPREFLWFLCAFRVCQPCFRSVGFGSDRFQNLIFISSFGAACCKFEDSQTSARWCLEWMLRSGGGLACILSYLVPASPSSGSTRSAVATVHLFCQMNGSSQNLKSFSSHWRSGLCSSSPRIIESLSLPLHPSSTWAVHCAHDDVIHLFSALASLYSCLISACNHSGRQRCFKFFQVYMTSSYALRPDGQLSRFPLFGRSGYGHCGTLEILQITSVWSPHTPDWQSGLLGGLSESLMKHWSGILSLNWVSVNLVEVRPVRCHICL